MSAYGKPPPPQNHGNGYDSGRNFPEGTFAYPAPIYGQSSVNSSTSSPAFQGATPMTQMGYSSGQPRSSYDDQAGPYLNVGSTPVPVVKDFTPQRGGRGTRLQVFITALYELLTTNEPTFFLVFGQSKVPASVTKISQAGSVCQYSLGADVPSFTATAWSSSQVPISMFMESGDGDVIAKVEVGNFSYIDPAPQSSTHQDSSRKRKFSTDSTEMNSSAKRLSGQLRPKEEFAQYGNFSPNETSSFSTYLQPSPAMQSSNYSVMPQYNRPPTYQAQRSMGYAYSNASPSGQKVQAPVATWGPSYPPISSLMRSPGVPSNTGTSRPLPSPDGSANPPLVRTTCIQQSPSPSNTPHGISPQYTSYSLYPHRAQLDLDGDLDSMASNWSSEEWEAHRRLVLFTRSQSGSTITAKFRKVTAEERPPNSICISCIMWAERKECFVTSVEIIALLEQLVAARFTVEEKNRIRRNLEGFRPLTVSKGKPESEEFFKIIMQFPPPKPRNIEKDVKVFHWKDLTSALKKIIGKYSASPSSTLPPAPALLTPVSSTGYATESSAATLSYADDHHGALSPRSISTTSTIYNANPNVQVRMSPHNQKSMILQASSNMRVPAPHPHDASQWQGGHHMQGSQYQQLSNQSARSWDISPNYMENPATAGSHVPQSQNLGYSTPRNSDASGLQDENRRLSTVRRQSQQMPRS